MIPANTSLPKSALTLPRSITTWPDDVRLLLQDCFDRTNWEIFEHPDMELYCDSVSAGLDVALYTVSVEKCIRVYPNQNPWMMRFSSC